MDPGEAGCGAPRSGAKPRAIMGLPRRGTRGAGHWPPAAEAPTFSQAAHRHGVSKAITSERGRVSSAKPTQFPKSSKPPPLRLKSVHCEIIIFSNLKNMAQK